MTATTSGCRTISRSVTMRSVGTRMWIGCTAPAVSWMTSRARCCLPIRSRVSTGRPRPFRRLACRRSADLHIFDDRDLIARILAGAGLFCGLQNSVIRRRVFDCLRFETASRNEAENQVFVIRAIAAGFRLAYFVDVHHVLPRPRFELLGVRPANQRREASAEKISNDLIHGFERLPALISLTKPEQRALRGRLARGVPLAPRGTSRPGSRAIARLHSTRIGAQSPLIRSVGSPGRRMSWHDSAASRLAERNGRERRTRTESVHHRGDEGGDQFAPRRAGPAPGCIHVEVQGAGVFPRTHGRRSASGGV